jgi:hypothetical protein
VKLSGDPDAVRALKAMHQKNPGFMKALLDDARSTTDHQTTFRDDAGVRYRLTLDPNTGDLNIVPLAEG